MHRANPHSYGLFYFLNRNILPPLFCHSRPALYSVPLCFTFLGTIYLPITCRDKFRAAYHATLPRRIPKQQFRFKCGINWQHAFFEIFAYFPIRGIDHTAKGVSPCAIVHAFPSPVVWKMVSTFRTDKPPNLSLLFACVFVVHFFFLLDFVIGFLSPRIQYTAFA